MAESQNKSKETKKKSSQEDPQHKPEARETSPGEEEKKEEKGLLSETAETIEAGAGAVGEKVTEIAGKTAETAGDVYDSVKKRLGSAYDTGIKWANELSRTAQQYVDNYKTNVEMKKLSDERDELTTKLGKTALAQYRQKETAPGKLLERKDLLELIKEIEKKDQEIVKKGKKLEN